MCLGIRILSLFYLAIQIIPIQNLNCPITLQTHAWTFMEDHSIILEQYSMFMNDYLIFTEDPSMRYYRFKSILDSE